MSNSTASELADLLGLESAKRVVEGLAAGSPVQSVLFYGMQGSGKERLARILAKAWLCKDPSDGGACGVCQACLAFDRDRSADLLWLEPKGASRIHRLAAIVPVEPDEPDYPISAHIFLRTPPLIARSKVVVLEDADRLNGRAGNALLKILEEPPPYGRFILLTDAVGSITPTILSRCLAAACEVPVSISGAESWAVNLASGAPGRALDLESFAEVYRPIYDFGLAIPTMRKPEALVAAQEFGALADALQTARKIGARAADAEALQTLASAYGLGTHKKASALKAMIEAHRRIVGNANAGSVFDALFVTILD